MGDWAFRRDGENDDKRACRREAFQASICQFGELKKGLKVNTSGLILDIKAISNALRLFLTTKAGSNVTIT